MCILLLQMHHVTLCFWTTIPYPERIGPLALSSAGPYPSEPPLRPESGRTHPHQDCPTLVHGGRPEAWGHLLKRNKENNLVFCALLCILAINLWFSPSISHSVAELGTVTIFSAW